MDETDRSKPLKGMLERASLSLFTGTPRSISAPKVISPLIPEKQSK
jgi:hypothetical protein